MVTKKELRQILKEGYSEGFTFHKTVTTAGVPEQLVKESTPCAQILVKALRSNGGFIETGFDGTNTLIGRGHELEPKESVVIPIDNVNKVWIDSTVNGEGVSVKVMR